MKRIKIIFRIFVWIVFIFGGSIVGLYLDNKIFPFINKNLLFCLLSVSFGFLLLLVTLRISKNTGRTLAKYGRKGNIPRLETDTLVTKGIYSYMRHPMHLGLMLFPLSTAFLVCSVSFILIISPIIIILMLLMIKFIEEPEAYQKFGDDYLNYIKKNTIILF